MVNRMILNRLILIIPPFFMYLYSLRNYNILRLFFLRKKNIINDPFQRVERLIDSITLMMNYLSPYNIRKDREIMKSMDSFLYECESFHKKLYKYKKEINKNRKNNSQDSIKIDIFKKVRFGEETIIKRIDNDILDDDEDTQDTQDTQDTSDIQDTSDKQDTKDIQDIQDTQDKQDKQYVQVSQDTQGNGVLAFS